MRVTRDQCQAPLMCESCNPDVIFGDRPTFIQQMGAYPSVGLGGSSIAGQDGIDLCERLDLHQILVGMVGAMRP